MTRAELMAYGREVIEAHSDLCLSDIHEQVEEHFASQFPEEPQQLLLEVIEELTDDLYNERSITALDNAREWKEHYGDIDEQKADADSYTAVGHAAEV